MNTFYLLYEVINNNSLMYPLKVTFYCPKSATFETSPARLTPNDLHNFVGTDNSCHAGNVVGINCRLMNFVGPLPTPPLTDVVNERFVSFYISMHLPQTIVSDTFPGWRKNDLHDRAERLSFVRRRSAP